MIQLEEYEAASVVWRKVAEHFETKLARLRRQLESNLDADQTLVVRQQIRDCREILASDPKYTPASHRADLNHAGE